MSKNPQYEDMDIDPKDVEESLDEAQLVSDDREDESSPEAPAVANVRVWIKGYGVMLTVRGEKMKDIIDKTETIVDYAVSHGWKETWNQPIPVGQVTTPQPTNPQAPICGIHGIAMTWRTGVSKTSGKPYAFYACAIKNADGSYCRFQPDKK